MITSDKNIEALHDLKGFEVALFSRLLDQAEEQGIDPKDAAAFARVIKRVDILEFLVQTHEAAAILEVSPRHVLNLIDTHPEWMTPFLTVKDESGTVRFMFFLRDKVEKFDQVRKAKKRARKRMDSESE